MSCKKAYSFSSQDNKCLAKICGSGKYEYDDGSGNVVCGDCHSSCSECVGPNNNHCTLCNSGVSLSPSSLNSRAGSCSNSCGNGSTNFNLSSDGICTEVCGKGTLLSGKIECDDNNSDDGDGCSSSC